MTTAPDPPPTNEAPPPKQHQVSGTRISGVWIASILFALVLLLLLIFILQNSEQVQISFFGLEGKVPLGVALLLSAVLGVLLVVIPGTARIMQLRLVARRHSAQDARLTRPQTPAAPPAAAPREQPPETAPPA